MKSIFLIIFLVCTIIISFDFVFGEEITVEIGKTESYEDLKFYFYDIEDSRCPIDLTCIWEGQVFPMIQISNETHKIGGPHGLNTPLTFFEPYEIVLFDVSPIPISTEKPDYVATLKVTKLQSELSDEQICGKGNVLINGICTPKKIWDSSDFRGLQTGETIPNHEFVIILESLGAGLIVLFIVIYAVRKRRKRK